MFASFIFLSIWNHVFLSMNLSLLSFFPFAKLTLDLFRFDSFFQICPRVTFITCEKLRMCNSVNARKFIKLSFIILFDYCNLEFFNLSSFTILFDYYNLEFFNFFFLSFLSKEG